MELAHSHTGSSSTWFLVELEFGCVGFWGEGKTGVPGGKTLGAREGTNNKLNPPMASLPGFEPGPHWWEASALTTAPPLPLLLDFSRIFQGQITVFKDYDLLNKSASLTPFWTPYWLRHAIYDFYFLSYGWSHYFILLSAKTLCKMTAYDLQMNLRYRNSISNNKETEIKYCISTKMLLPYPWILQVLTQRMSPIFLSEIT